MKDMKFESTGTQNFALIIYYQWQPDILLHARTVSESKMKTNALYVQHFMRIDEQRRIQDRRILALPPSTPFDFIGGGEGMFF